VNEWPGRRRAESSRQWPTLQGTVRRAEELEAVVGLIAIGSFAQGDPDELSDLDLLAVVESGRFREAWGERLRLADDPLVTWDGRVDPANEIRWFTWLTRDLVKVECGIVDPDSANRELAEPFAVLVGEPSLADRFVRIPLEVVEARVAELRERQRVFDPDEMTPGEKIGWKLSEFKNAVRDALQP
jgi:predicted nucleotidyltransferase